jgi:hypothetical protein
MLGVITTMKPHEFKETILVAFVLTLLTVLLSTTLGHCLGPSPQTNHEIVMLYIKQHNYTLDYQTRHRIASSIISNSEIGGIPYEIITAIMRVESGYNPGAVGPLGEIGLMQIYTMRCGDIEFDPALLPGIDYNITAGVCILLDKLDAASGDLFTAIKLYNGRGPAAEIFRRKVVRVVIDIFRFRVAQHNSHNRRRVTLR